MFKLLVAFGASTAALVAVVHSSPADARSHSRSIEVDGARRGYVRSRDVERTRGSSSIVRMIETDSGRSAAMTRNAEWGDGNYAVDISRSFSDGRTSGRSVSLATDEDGIRHYSATRTGRDGRSRTVTRTGSRPRR